MKKDFTQTGPWPEAEVKTFLGDSRVPVRVASNSASGHPLLASLWLVPLEGSLWCATEQKAQTVEAPPYLGVRARATDVRQAQPID